jgi:phosphoglucomutase
MVHFGTSGWRGVIGRDITFRKVRIVTQALIDTLRGRDALSGPVMVGYDTRMLSEKFARTAAELLAANGVPAVLTVRDLPSPALGAAVADGAGAAGLMFTGSHNAPEYNGLKIYTADGALAPSDYTDPIEDRFRELERDFEDVFLPRREYISEQDFKQAYLDRLQRLIDWEAIRASGLFVAVDPLFGSAREYLDHILLENDIPVTVIHNTRDPFFGGYAPDCTSDNLTRLRDVMRRSGARLGLSTDGDGDRFGILDAGARMCDPYQALALALDYLARRRGLKGRIGRSVATSHLIDAVAEVHGLEVLEAAVGFKSFGPLLVEGTITWAGEESAGLAWAEHLPERDGVLACLLMAEIVAVEGSSLADLSQKLAARVGAYHFRRIQLPLTERTDRIFERRLNQKWKELDGRAVATVDRTAGLKLTFDNGAWILARRAGTEPKIRLYAEGRSGEELRHLIHQLRTLFSERRT